MVKKQNKHRTFFFLFIVFFFILQISAIGIENIKECDKIVSEFHSREGAANYCTKNDDCTILSVGCPFGCGSYINKKEKESLMEHASLYSRNKNCSDCMYDCVAPVKPVCENNRCVMSICQVDQEYNSFDCMCPPATEYADTPNKATFKCVPINNINK